jgi:hypothetical protein
MNKAFLAVVALLSATAGASAQDFGNRWGDKILRELHAERGPLQNAFDYDASAGLFAYYDSNLLLTPEGRQIRDGVLIPFVQGRIEYSEPTLDLAADLVVNYKSYSDEDDFSDDEERFFGRAAYVGSEFNAGLAVIVRHESDPTDVVFVDRVARTVGDLMPWIKVDLSPVVTLEANGQAQIVRFEEQEFADPLDNTTLRGDLSVVYETEWAVSVVLNGGALSIAYVEDDITPDTDGYFVRGGLRGELVPEFSYTFLVGYIHGESDDFPSGAEGDEESTTDVTAMVSYTGLESWVFTASYNRTLAFAGSGEPFQIVNRGLLIVEYLANEYLVLQGRGQADFTYTASGVERTYVTASGSATVKAMENLFFDAGASYRTGETGGTSVIESVYDGIIYYVGAAVAF